MTHNISTYYLPTYLPTYSTALVFAKLGTLVLYISVRSPFGLSDSVNYNNTHFLPFASFPLRLSRYLLLTSPRRFGISLAWSRPDFLFAPSVLSPRPFPTISALVFALHVLPLLLHSIFIRRAYISDFLIICTNAIPTGKALCLQPIWLSVWVLFMLNRTGER